jgi:hypothetical protein
MMPDVWSLLLLLLKLFSYSAMASSAGAVLLLALLRLNHTADRAGCHHFRLWLNRWLLNWSVAGMVLAVLQLPLQAGAFAESGPAAMMDTLMLSIVWQSAIGSQSVMRLSGFALLLLAALLWPRSGKAAIVGWFLLAAALYLWQLVLALPVTRLSLPVGCKRYCRCMCWRWQPGPELCGRSGKVAISWRHRLCWR